MAEVEVSPGGVGFIRTDAHRDIPGTTEEVRNARRRWWIAGRTNPDAEHGCAWGLKTSECAACARDKD